MVHPNVEGSGVTRKVLVAHLEIGMACRGERAVALVLHYASLLDYYVSSELVPFDVEASTEGGVWGERSGIDFREESESSSTVDPSVEFKRIGEHKGLG